MIEGFVSAVVICEGAGVREQAWLPFVHRQLARMAKEFELIVVANNVSPALSEALRLATDPCGLANLHVSLQRGPGCFADLAWSGLRHALGERVLLLRAEQIDEACPERLHDLLTHTGADVDLAYDDYIALPMRQQHGQAMAAAASPACLPRFLPTPCVIRGLRLTAMASLRTPAAMLSRPHCWPCATGQFRSQKGAPADGRQHALRWARAAHYAVISRATHMVLSSAAFTFVLAHAAFLCPPLPWLVVDEKTVLLGCAYTLAGIAWQSRQLVAARYGNEQTVLEELYSLQLGTEEELNVQVTGHSPAKAIPRQQRPDALEKRVH